MSRTTTAPQLIGSSWDTAAGPEATAPHHLAEWVNGSAVAPELAAANVETLQGSAVLEALAGDRLEQLGGEASQYATGAVSRLLAPLEPLAAAGGWWCSGLDPLADWAPMGWGCFKPDRPRLDPERQRPRKYEHPTGTPARLFWLRVPAAIAQRVADRFELALPPEVAADATGAAGAFWRWWARTPALPLLMTEGAKKAAALLSAGVPAVAAPGIWNPSPKGANGRPALHSDLAAVPLRGRPCSVLFDWSDSHAGRQDVARAARRLGRLLAAAGAADVRVGCCPGPAKGADDHLAAGGTWEQLAAALSGEPLGARPVLPHLRAPDRIAPAGRYLGEAGPLPSPEAAPLLALSAPMGAGKTAAIAAAVAPLLAAGVRVVLVSHRRSLGAALAERLGLPWGEDAKPGSDLRQQGIALCIDSLCPSSGLRFRPSEWAGAVVVIDEAAAVLAHAVTGTGTAIAHRRPEVLQALAQLMAASAQTIAADAQLDAATLEALEAATGRRALLIGSNHRPAAGRSLIVHPTRDSWRAQLLELLGQRRRLWIATTAAEPGSKNGARNLADLAAECWPGARVLRVDAETVAQPGHDAAALADNPDRIAAGYDVVVASPAVAAGLSVTLRDHFAAVMVAAGGTTDPEAVAQAAARVRDDCPRHLYAPERSPGAGLRVGCGSTDPADVLRHLRDHEAAAVAQLIAAGWSAGSNNAGPWLRLWALLAARRNCQRLAYSATVAALLEREGYRAVAAAELEAAQLEAAQAAGQALKRISTTAQALADAAVADAELLEPHEATKLAKQRQRSPDEAAQLERYRIATAWGLGDAPPTPELLQADRDGLNRRGRFGWLLQDLEARQLAARADLSTARGMAAGGRHWAPDLCRETIGSKLAAADAMGLPRWLQRSEWFGADDPQLLELQALTTAHGAALAQVLALSPGKRATTTLRGLLRLAGYRLESRRQRCGEGRRAGARYRYRVVAEALPAGADRQRLALAWESELLAAAGAGGGVPKNPIQIWGETGPPPPQPSPSACPLPSGDPSGRRLIGACC
jgi:hypothetical protein